MAISLTNALIYPALILPAHAQIIAKGSSGAAANSAAESPTNDNQSAQTQPQSQPATKIPAPGGDKTNQANPLAPHATKSGAGMNPVNLPENEPINTQPDESGSSGNLTPPPAPAQAGRRRGWANPPVPTLKGPTSTSVYHTAGEGEAGISGSSGQPPAAVTTRGANNSLSAPGTSAAPETSTATIPSSAYVTINEVLNEALLRSPRAAALRAQLAIQKSLYPAATMMPDPQVFRDEAPVSEQVLRMGAQRTWDPPWKIAFRLMAAKAQFKETKLETLNSLWSFRSDVRRAYLEVVMAQETYDTLSELADLSNRLLTITSKLFKAGSIAELDVLKARLAASQAETDRNQGAIRVALALQSLNIIMGRNRDSAVGVARIPQSRNRAERTGLLPNLAKQLPPIDDYMAMAYSNRLDLRVLSAQIKVAEAQLRTAYGNIIPDPVLTTGYSANNNGPSGPKIKAFFVTMNYEVPTFTYSQADIPRLKYTIRQYQAQITATRNQIQSDVTTAYTHLIAARKKIAIYQDHILDDSEKVARLARRSYEVGQTDITSTLAAQQANVQVKQAYLDAINTYQQAFTELEQAVGVPLI